MEVWFCDDVSSHSVSIVSRSELFSGRCGWISSLWIFSEYRTLVSSLVFGISETFDDVFANEKKRAKCLHLIRPLPFFATFCSLNSFRFICFYVSHISVPKIFPFLFYFITWKNEILLELKHLAENSNKPHYICVLFRMWLIASFF